jgi:uncharacterized protein YkwD
LLRTPALAQGTTEGSAQQNPNNAPRSAPGSETAQRSDESRQDDEQRFLQLANEEREERGLAPLQWDSLLASVARKHSEEMREKKYFNHRSPTRGSEMPLDRYLLAAGSRPRYACVGENLYYCVSGNVLRGHRAFMNSAGHRENILFARYEKMGVGIVRSPKGECWVTVMFLASRDGGEQAVYTSDP